MSTTTPRMPRKARAFFQSISEPIRFHVQQSVDRSVWMDLVIEDDPNMAVDRLIALSRRQGEFLSTLNERCRPKGFELLVWREKFRAIADDPEGFRSYSLHRASVLALSNAYPEMVGQRRCISGGSHV